MRILLAICLLVAPAVAQNMKILLVEGQGAINPVDRSTQRNLTVRVEEQYGAPGKAIPVTFTLPNSGPGGYFKDGQTTVTLTTDDKGYVTVKGFRPNDQAGQYNIRVTAATPGGAIHADIPQTNAAVSTEEQQQPSRRKLIFTIVAAAAAGSAAIVGLAGK